MTEKMDTRAASETTAANPLGAYLRKARLDMPMTLREVEEATNKEVSNGYLSQLESGKISKPSPHVLHTLSTVLNVDYETLMQRAGYILPGASRRTKGAKHGRVATFAIDNLTTDEEAELLKYLNYLRSMKK